MEYKIFVDYSSVGKLGTTVASINCTGKSNAAKGIENHYNKCRKFHLRESEAHVVAPFMEMTDMKKKKVRTISVSVSYASVFASKR